MKNHVLTALLAVSLCASLTGAAWAETLQDTVQTAIASHPSVLAAKEAQGAAEQTVKEQRSAYFPELNASITAGRVYGDNATSRGLSVTRGAGYSNLGEGSASVSQRLIDWGETGNKVGAAKARHAAAQDTVVSTQESIALRAVQAYVGLLRAGELKAKAAANLESMKAYRDKIEIAVKSGGSDEAELNRANDFLLLAQNAASEFQGTYEQALADYVEAAGAPPESALTRPILPGAFPPNLDAAIDAAFSQHPQVMAAKEALVASDHDKRAEKANYFPKIKSELSYLKRDQADIIGGEATDARAVMKMDWAYSTGGAQLARVARADHNRAQAKAQLDEIYRRVERDVRVAWSTLDVERQQEKTQQDRRAATSKVVETYKTQYEGDKRTLIELMQAESQSFDASVAYANADYGVMNATYTLLAAMGRLVPALQPSSMPATGEPSAGEAGSEISSDDR